MVLIYPLSARSRDNLFATRDILLFTSGDPISALAIISGIGACYLVHNSLTVLCFYCESDRQDADRLISFLRLENARR